MKAKLSHLAIGDLVKIYKRIFRDYNVLKSYQANLQDIYRILDEVPAHRNKLAHTAASLEGWDELFQFLLDFIPLRHALSNYFEGISL